MKDRIKEIRKALGMTQVEFANRLGISRSALTKLESGENAPSGQSIILMVKEMNVNEEWLRTGIGDMFIDLSAEDELNAYLSKVSDLSEDDPRRKIIMMMAKIPEQYWGTIREILDVIAEK